MKTITRLSVLTFLVLAIGLFATTANAQVSIGIQIGQPVYPGQTAYPVMPVNTYGPPNCSWGYYDYYPYACAPQGYYGPEFFVSYGGPIRTFVGVGPWRGWYQSHPHYYDNSPRYRNEWRGQRWSVNTRRNFESRNHYQAPVRFEPQHRSYSDQQHWEQQRRDQNHNDQRGHNDQHHNQQGNDDRQEHRNR